MVSVRPATSDDVAAIAALIAQNVRKGGLLPRDEADIRAHLDDFLVAEDGDADQPGRVIGCGSLVPMNATLVELRSLAVDEHARGGGVGRRLVAALVEEARRRQFGTIFALTRAVGFFEKCGFSVVPKEFFPEKVWNDCVACPMLENCDEVAVMMPLQPDRASEFQIRPEDRERVLRAVQAGRLARRAVSRENLIPLETVTRLHPGATPAAGRGVRKVVLAYSGGLDSAVIVPWLIETYQCEVVCFVANIGQREDLDAVCQRALHSGAAKVVVKDLRDEFANEFLLPLLQSGAIYEGGDLLGAPIARPLIAKHQVMIAKQEEADALAHGATGKGNDQVCFELAYMALNPNLRVIAPWREWQFTSRDELLAYARARHVPLDLRSDAAYTLDENLWHCSREGGELEDLAYEPAEALWRWTNALEEAPNQPEHLEVEFVNGIPKRLNGLSLSGAALIERVNEIGALHGVGRSDFVVNRLVGMKSRRLQEAPAATILRAAHQALEQLVLDRETMHFKQLVALRYADLVYSGQWFTPLRDALQAFITVTQRDVTGSVHLKLFKGHVQVVQRQAAYSLYRADLATLNGSEHYRHDNAQGFVQVYGLPTWIKAQLDQQRAARRSPTRKGQWD